MKHTASVIKASLLLGIASLPFTSHAMPLEDAVRHAVYNHPSLKISASEEHSAQATLGQAKAGYYPTISATVTAGRLYADNTTTRGLTVDRGAGYSGLFEGNATISQTLFSGFATSSQVTSAKSRLDAAELGAVESSEQVALQSVNTYMNLARVTELLRLSRVHYATIVDYAQKIDLAVQSGGTTEAELQQAMTLRNQVERMSTQFEGQHANARATYHNVIGIPAENISPIKEIISAILTHEKTYDLLPDDPNDAILQAFARHPGLMANKMEAKAVQSDIKAQEAAYYPTVTAELSYLERDQRDVIGGESTDARGIVRMNWQFATGGTVAQGVKQQAANLSRTRAQNEQLRRQIATQIRQAYTERKTSLRLADLAQRNLDISQQLLAAQKNEFESGGISQLQLAQTTQQVFSNQIDLINQQTRQAVAYLTALQATSQLRRLFDIPGVASQTASAE